MSGEEQAARGSGRLGPERLTAFSDGVVAIALTLLVLPLAELVPDRAERGFPASSLITDNLPLIGSFLLSFVTIGRFWMVHHRVFDGIRSTDRGIVWCNLAWLLTIVVLPFPTEMVGVLSQDPFTLRFYVATLFANSLLLSLLAVLVARADEAAAPVPLSAWATPAILLVVLVLALVRPGLGYTPLLLLFATPLIEAVLRRVLGHTRTT